MEDLLQLDLELDGKEWNFVGKLVSIGYQSKLIFLVNGFEVTFEPDEERKYRAILNGSGLDQLKDIDRRIIQAVAERLEKLRA